MSEDTRIDLSTSSDDSSPPSSIEANERRRSKRRCFRPADPKATSTPDPSPASNQRKRGRPSGRVSQDPQINPSPSEKPPIPKGRCMCGCSLIRVPATRIPGSPHQEGWEDVIPTFIYVCSRSHRTRKRCRYADPWRLRFTFSDRSTEEVHDSETSASSSSEILCVPPVPSNVMVH